MNLPQVPNLREVEESGPNLREVEESGPNLREAEGPGSKPAGG